MPLQDFDARSVKPNQGGTAHPPGMHDFIITNTHLQENKDQTGAMLVVEMTSPVGMIENRYNVINPSPDAVRISNEQLSALCHAVNIFQVAYPKTPDGAPVMEMAGHTLRGGKGRMEIVPQLGKDGQPNGYMKVKKVFDSQGNEPGKALASGTQMQPQQQPAQQANWGNQQPQQQANPQNAAQNPGWSNGPSAQQPAQQQPNANPNKPSWA